MRDQVTRQVSFPASNGCQALFKPPDDRESSFRSSSLPAPKLPKQLCIEILPDIGCHAFNIEHDGSSFKCERRLIEEAYNLNNHGKNIIVIIDDAHLMDMNTLRKLRLLFEDFPKNHNIILSGQVQMLHSMALTVNEDIKSRVTYSTILKKLNPDDMETFILNQLDAAGLPHNTFTENALALVVRSADGILRKAKNLCLSCMVEAVRSGKKIIDIDNVNSVLIQPYWRIEKDLEHLL